MNKKAIMEQVTNDPVWKAGVKEGYQQCQMKVLTFLEDRYIKDEGRPDRGSEGGKAILKLAQELSAYLKSEKP